MKLRFSRPAGRFLALAAAAGLLQLLFRLCLRAEGDGGAALLVVYMYMFCLKFHHYILVFLLHYNHLLHHDLNNTLFQLLPLLA